MGEIDDELLALAGGGGGESSDDESERGNRDDGSASPPQPPPPPRKGSKKASTAVPDKPPRRARQGDDSEEEGEASSTPGTPNSLESAPMDESDSDAEPASKPPPPSVPARTSPPDDDEHKYPFEGLYASREEKEEIENMVEFEREQLLAERAAEVEKMRQNRILRQLVTNQEMEEKKKKRSADTADLDDRDRKSSRQRVNTKPGETSSAIDTLRRAKAEKNDRLRRRVENRDRQRDDSRSPPRGDRRGGSRSSSTTPSPSRHRGRRSASRERPQAVRESPPADLRDVERLRVGRRRFAEHCLTPGFAKAIAGCYVRISVGPHPDTGVDQYRMAHIKEITTSRPYAMEGVGGIFVTDQYIKAAHGSSAREFPFISCSDKPFNEAEWNRYKVTCANDNSDIPNKDQMVRKISDINALINHEWTDAEILAKVARKDELRRRFDPAERERLAKQIAAAREGGDASLAERLQDRLDDLNRSRLAFRTTLAAKTASPSKGKSQQDRLAELNRENRRKNADNVRRAQLMEKAKMRGIDSKLARGENVREDHSRQPKIKAKFVQDVNGAAGLADASGKVAGGGSDAPGVLGPTTATADAQQAAMKVRLAKLREEKYSKGNGMPELHKPLHDDDIIGSLDLDIDVEI